MSSLVFEILLIVALILMSGAFVAAETSMISMRESQVRQLALTRGKRGRRLERLVSDPNRFLAAVQIGVTFATMLSSAFGAATVADRVSGSLVRAGMSEGLADPLALIGITLVISFLSLVLGELAPKRLGLQRSETIALFASGPLSVLARLFRPVVWLLGKCTNGVVRLFGGDPRAKGEVISQEELQSLVEAHESLTSVERRVIADVFAAEDTRVREVMVARPDVEFLQGSLTVSRAARQAVAHRHSRFPVIGEDVDDVIGVVRLRDLLAPTPGVDRSATVADIAEAVAVIPGTKGVLDALHRDAHRGATPGGGGRRVRRHRRHRDDRGPDRGDRRRDAPGRGGPGDVRNRDRRRPGGGRRPAEPGRLRRTDRAPSGPRPVRHGGRIPDGAPWPGPAHRGQRRVARS